MIRDAAGVVVSCLSKRVAELFSPHVAECIAMREGLEMATTCGLVVESVESGVVNIVQAIKSTCSVNEAGPIINGIKACLFQVFGGIVCRHISCSSNMVAHHLANLAFYVFDDVFGLDVIPKSIGSVVLADLAT